MCLWCPLPTYALFHNMHILSSVFLVEVSVHTWLT